MKLQRQIDQLISQQASDWIEVLKTGGPKERAAFVTWLKESRRHVGEFLAMVAVDQELNRLDRRHQYDLDSLLGKISPHIARLPAQRAAPAQRRPIKVLSWPVGLAAGLTVAAGLAWFMYAQSSWKNYSTSVGEQRAVELPDGSLLHLNTHSAVQVRFNSSARDLRLVRGEALFKVAPDTRRPFRVQVHETTVQALGTQFNIYDRKDVTTVSVLEGKVKLLFENNSPERTPPRVNIASSAQRAFTALSAGEEASIRGARSWKRDAIQNTDEVTAWRSRRLIFRNDTLQDIATEFNRYNSKLKFRLEGDAVKQRHYSGTFDADDPQSLAALISREHDVNVESTAEEIIIRGQ